MLSAGGVYVIYSVGCRVVLEEFRDELRDVVSHEFRCEWLALPFVLLTGNDSRLQHFEICNDMQHMAHRKHLDVQNHNISVYKKTMCRCMKRENVTRRRSTHRLDKESVCNTSTAHLNVGRLR